MKKKLLSIALLSSVIVCNRPADANGAGGGNVGDASPQIAESALPGDAGKIEENISDWLINKNLVQEQLEKELKLLQEELREKEESELELLSKLTQTKEKYRTRKSKQKEFDNKVADTGREKAALKAEIADKAKELLRSADEIDQFKKQLTSVQDELNTEKNLRGNLADANILLQSKIADTEQRLATLGQLWDNEKAQYITHIADIQKDLDVMHNALKEESKQLTQTATITASERQESYNTIERLKEELRDKQAAFVKVSQEYDRFLHDKKYVQENKSRVEKELNEIISAQNKGLLDTQAKLNTAEQRLANISKWAQGVGYIGGAALAGYGVYKFADWYTGGAASKKWQAIRNKIASYFSPRSTKVSKLPQAPKGRSFRKR